jgi:hypothetical protein
MLMKALGSTEVDVRYITGKSLKEHLSPQFSEQSFLQCLGLPVETTEAS